MRDRSSGTCTATLTGHRGRVGALTSSPDSTWLATTGGSKYGDGATERCESGTPRHAALRPSHEPNRRSTRALGDPRTTLQWEAGWGCTSFFNCRFNPGFRLHGHNIAEVARGTSHRCDAGCQSAGCVETLMMLPSLADRSRLALPG
ncbi:WD40 repeat domain-containing protein [Streptomyces sp. NPDC097610]|uniref:WD40 repeat domain-containing protein n=1 Tax=Streptomyces sp. NPDC097610 TaxID=3157227 RepID=UPI00332705A9